MIFTPRRSNSGLMLAMYPSSVVHTGVKSFGCENSTAHESPIQSWKEILPSVVSASKSGAVSPSCNAMLPPKSCRGVVASPTTYIDDTRPELGTSGHLGRDGTFRRGDSATERDRSGGGAQELELPAHRPSHPLYVTRCEQIEHGASQHGEEQRAQLGVRGGLTEDVEPVRHRRRREACPRSIRLDQRTGVALHPELEQASVLLGREPGPHGDRHRQRITVPTLAGGHLPSALEQRQLIPPCSGQQCLHESRLAPEEKQEHARARPHGRGQRPQRDVGDAVLERVLVGSFQELIAPRRGGGGHRGVV